MDVHVQWRGQGWLATQQRERGDQEITLTEREGDKSLNEKTVSPTTLSQGRMEREKRCTGLSSLRCQPWPLSINKPSLFSGFCVNRQLIRIMLESWWICVYQNSDRYLQNSDKWKTHNHTFSHGHSPLSSLSLSLSPYLSSLSPSLPSLPLSHSPSLSLYIPFH